MYTVDEHDRVRELGEVPKPDSGAPDPIVVADEQAVVLCYVSGSCHCFVRFHLAHSHLFGAPNDEAIEGHPLWKRGLEPYGVFRVDESSLIRRLALMNSVHTRHSYSMFEALTHYIFTFHDSTFECVARSYRVVVEQNASLDRYVRAVELLHQRPPSDITQFERSDSVSGLYRRLPAVLRFVVDVFRS